MSTLFNNLLINKESKKYPPFLLNLLSGRRRLLSKSEFPVVCSMIKKSDIKEFNLVETEFYEKLNREKQFLTDEKRKNIETKMLNTHNFKGFVTNDFRFTIQISQDCNMSCPYCFEKAYRHKKNKMTKEHIDAIYDFYQYYGNSF